MSQAVKEMTTLTNRTPLSGLLTSEGPVTSTLSWLSSLDYSGSQSS